MPTRLEQFNSDKIAIAKAMAKNDQTFLHEKVHVVDVEAERERKLKNPKKSTKIILNCRTPEQWKEMHAAKEPYFEIAVDPQIAIDCMIRALSAFSKETIAEWVKQGFSPGEPPPKANIPNEPLGGEIPEELDWLK